MAELSVPEEWPGLVQEEGRRGEKKRKEDQKDRNEESKGKPLPFEIEAQNSQHQRYPAADNDAD
jgi:hypothetical protein